MEPADAEVLLGQATCSSPCTRGQLPSRLRGIQRRARTVVEETGANNLFLTLGMLEWEDAGREARAPLFLLPVTIARAPWPAVRAPDRAMARYAQPNQCLLEKLRIAHGLVDSRVRRSGSRRSGIDLAGSLQAIRMALVEAELPFSDRGERARLAAAVLDAAALAGPVRELGDVPAQPGRPAPRRDSDRLVRRPGRTAERPRRRRGVALLPDPDRRLAARGRELGRSGPLVRARGAARHRQVADDHEPDRATRWPRARRCCSSPRSRPRSTSSTAARRRSASASSASICTARARRPRTCASSYAPRCTCRRLDNAESWAAVRAAIGARSSSLGRYPAPCISPAAPASSAWRARQALIDARRGDRDRRAGRRRFRSTRHRGLCMPTLES